MPKATIEFNLNDYDDLMAHNRFVKSGDMALALWHITHDLRGRCADAINNALKNKEIEDKASEAVDVVLEVIGDVLVEFNIYVEDLTH